MTASPETQRCHDDPETFRSRGTLPARAARDIYLLLLIDAQDHIVQTVVLRAAAKKRAVEIGEALRTGTPRAHRYQLWFGGCKVFELPSPSPLH